MKIESFSSVLKILSILEETILFCLKKSEWLSFSMFVFTKAYKQHRMRAKTKLPVTLRKDFHVNHSHSQMPLLMKCNKHSNYGSNFSAASFSFLFFSPHFLPNLHSPYQIRLTIKTPKSISKQGLQKMLKLDQRKGSLTKEKSIYLIRVKEEKVHKRSHYPRTPSAR